MKKWIAAWLMILAVLMTVPAFAEIRVADLDFEAEVTIAHHTSVSVRKYANGESERIGWAKTGERFKYLGDRNGWFMIEYNGGTGFVSNDLAVAHVTKSNNTKFVRVTHWNAANVRAWHSEKTKKVAFAAPETVMPYMGEEEGWYRVRMNRRTGYVSGNLCELIDNADGMRMASYSSAAQSR